MEACQVSTGPKPSSRCWHTKINVLGLDSQGEVKGCSRTWFRAPSANHKPSFPQTSLSCILPNTTLDTQVLYCESGNLKQVFHYRTPETHSTVVGFFLSFFFFLNKICCSKHSFTVAAPVKKQSIPIKDNTHPQRTFLPFPALQPHFKYHQIKRS